MNRFENQVAVISGGAEGLGKGIAHRLASEGCSIALFDINEMLLKQTVHDFKKKGYVVEGVVADVASETSVKHAFDQVGKIFSKVDVMVNAAGIIGPTAIKITDYKTEDFDNIYGINIRSHDARKKIYFAYYLLSSWKKLICRPATGKIKYETRCEG